ARIQHIDDHTRIRAWQQWLRSDTPPEIAQLDTREGRLQVMLLAALVENAIALDDREEAFDRVWRNRAVRDETLQMLEVPDDTLRRTSHDDFGPVNPIKTHGTYSLAEIMAGYGIVRNGKLAAPREGVLWHKPSRTDLLFITVHKDPDEYAPQHMFNDYP